MLHSFVNRVVLFAKIDIFHCFLTTTIIIIYVILFSDLLFLSICPLCHRYSSSSSPSSSSSSFSFSHHIHPLNHCVPSLIHPIHVSIQPFHHHHQNPLALSALGTSRQLCSQISPSLALPLHPLASAEPHVCLRCCLPISSFVFLLFCVPVLFL